MNSQEIPIVPRRRRRGGNATIEVPPAVVPQLMKTREKFLRLVGLQVHRLARSWQRCPRAACRRVRRCRAIMACRN